MADQMTHADLSALRALADAATPGPWRWTDEGYLRSDAKHFTRDVWVIPMSEGDVAFIAAARTAVPRLLDLAEGLAKEREEIARNVDAAAGRANALAAAMLRRASRAEAELDRLARDLALYRTESVEAWQERARVAKEATVTERDGYLAALRVQQNRTDNAESERDAARAEVERLTTLQRAAAEITGASPGTLAHSCSGVASCLACGKFAIDQRARADALQAEVERLRGALRRWSGRPCMCIPVCREQPDKQPCDNCLARTVLGEEGTT